MTLSIQRLSSFLTFLSSWLPPPVLAMLNDKQIEAAKLAAMVTTALQWLLNNVPEGALPPTLRPALMLVKSLVPYLGYIGGFVAWSWEGIKSFDVGFGVLVQQVARQP